ncbi:hypothetical protein BDW02DRAFT_550995 [Decorospora gaudefroyi]|uniref:Uncharacterized protein n=1 Tax=Decorospora gaudefroyi TaxID=184978 RepID=A0A6A5KD58_9PLEO|nr:hypothetical protein BDW02DRAFT_550995 [Decorospora gaudefroyi]
MTDLGAALSSELTRIIECPYPASLSNLAGLLTRADTHAVRACIQDRPRCAVSKLATIVYSALPLGAYTLRVLHRLCHAPEFRDELLLLEPQLLNHLLSKANSSQQDFEQYGQLCVLLLSRALPDAIPLPATAHTFFLNVFANATHNPKADTLKPVYCMLNGACRRLHSLLPSDMQRRFDSELCTILKSITAGNSTMLLLWICGIVLFAEHPGHMKGTQILHAGPEPPISTESLRQQWTTPSGQKLFGSLKDLYKTINLTCLNVIWILRGQVVEDDAIEGIRIASRVLQFIDRDVKDNWPKSEDKADSLFRRIPAKILGSGATPPVVFETLSFYAVLAGSKSLPQEIVTQYESSISKAACTTDPDRVAEILSVSLPLFGPQIRDGAVENLLSDILEACASKPVSHQLAYLISLVDELTTATVTCGNLRTKILHALSSTSLQGKLSNFLAIMSENKIVGYCTHAASLHQHFISATIASLLTIALAAHPGESQLPFTFTAALVNKQRSLQLSTGHCQCVHSSDSSKPLSISFFQQASTPYTGQHRQDWSKRLHSELESQNTYQTEAIMRSVAQICGDLEARCNTVEEPLQREKEKSTAFEAEVSQLTQQAEELQAKLVDDVYHLQGLEKELEDANEEVRRLERENLEIVEEKESKCARLQEIEVSLDESNRNAREELLAAQESFSGKDLAFQSKILRLEEEIRSRHVAAEELCSTISQLKESQLKQEQDYYSLNKRYEHHQARLHETEEKLKCERTNSSCQVDEMARLEKQVSEYQVQLENRESELKDAIQQLRILQDSHQELERTSEQTMRSMAGKHAHDMEAATARADEDRKALNIQLQNVLQDCQREKDNHSKTQGDLQRSRALISLHESRIEELQGVCKKENDELDKLKTMCRTVLAQVGYPSQEPLAIRSASRSQQEIPEPRTMREPRSHRRRKSAITTQDGEPEAPRSTQGITNTAMENPANASFASSESYSSQSGGPTPKRSKPWSSFKVAAMQTPHMQKPIPISKSVSSKLSPVKRSALRQMSPNRRHTVGFAVAESEEEGGVIGILSPRKRRGSLNASEQADFNLDDEFLACTPLTPGFMAGTGKVPDEFDDDATTTEL